MCGPGQRIPASGPNPVTTSRPGRRTRAGAEPFFQEPIPRTRPRPPVTGPVRAHRPPRGPFHPCRSASPNLPRPVRRPRLSGLSIRPDSRQLRMRAASAPHATAYPHRKSHHRPHAPLRLLPPPPPPPGGARAAPAGTRDPRRAAGPAPAPPPPARTYDGPPGPNPVPPVVTPSGRRPTHTLPRPVLIPSGHCPCRLLALPPTHTAPGPDPAPLRPILPILFAPFSLYSAYSASFSRLLLRAFPFLQIFSIGNLFYRKINATFVPLSLTNNDENA